MPEHEYDAEVALKKILERIELRSPELAEQILEAINQGKVDQMQDNANTKKQRLFSKTRPYTDEEAIMVAIKVLQAYFLELPACIEAASTEFTLATIRFEDETTFPFYEYENEELESSMEGEPKQIVIDQIGETRKLGSMDEDLIVLETVNREDIEDQENNLENLKSLLDFS